MRKFLLAFASLAVAITACAEKFIAGPDVIESKPSGLIFIVR